MPPTPTLLLVPGWHDSGPGHWQSLWAQDARHWPGAQRVVQDEWAQPRRSPWVERLAHTLEALLARGPVVLAAHSLGCITVAHLPGALLARVHAALLVAPADPTRHPQLADFAPTPRKTLPCTSLVVASDNDPYCLLSRSAGCARDWGSAWFMLKGAGHINRDSGHGDWPEGRALLQALVAGPAAAAGSAPGPACAFPGNNRHADLFSSPAASVGTA